MKPRSNTNARSVEIGSKTKMKPSATRTACMSGAIAGPAQPYLFQAMIGLSTTAATGQVKLTHVDTVERSSAAAEVSDGRGTQRSMTGMSG